MFKVVFQHAPKFFTGSLIAAVATVLMTKYYTFVFTPADYGVLAMYLVMFEYIKTLASLNLDSSATRFYFDYRKTHRDEYLSTILWFLTFQAALVLIIGLIFMPLISDWIAIKTRTIYMVTLGTGIASVYVSFFTRILYNEHKSTSVLKHSIFQTLVNHATSFILISVFNLGILGRISGQGIGYGVNIYSLLKEFAKNNLFKIRLVFNRLMAKETFLLSLPGMISMTQGIAFLYLDRIFLKHYIGNTAVGIYTLGYMLGRGLSIVYESVSQAMLPKVFNDMISDYVKAKAELEKFSYLYYAGLIVITIIVSFLSPVLVALISNEKYSESATVMPFVMAGFMMGGFYKIPALVLGYHKRV